MRFSVIPGILAAALAVSAQHASAQGYNTLVVEIPYEFSVPSSFVTAVIYCQNTIAPYELLRKEHRIPLVNGRASGSLKYGWDLNGSVADLDVEASETARAQSASPDYEIQVNCTASLLSEGSSGDPTVRKGPSGYYVYDGKEFVLLEGETDPSVVRVTLTHGDNELTQAAAGSTTTVDPASVPAGLQGLQTILGDQ